MSVRRVLLHSCGPSREPTGAQCCCTQKITARRARALVDGGSAVWWKRSDGTDVHYAVALIGAWRPARTISALDVESAYVDDVQRARKRIEEFDPRKSKVR